MAKKTPNSLSDMSSDNHTLAPAAETALEPSTNGRKRKAVVIPRAKMTAVQDNDVDDDATLGTIDAPQSKGRTVKKVKIEETVDIETITSARKTASKTNGTNSQVSARPKRAGVKKAIVEEEEAVADDKAKTKTKTTTVAKAARPKRVATAVKHAKILPPLEQRTQNIKHRIGAHVSIAGGKLYFNPEEHFGCNTH